MRAPGFSLLETTLAMGLMGILGAAGGASLPGPGLAFVPGEMRGALDQAFLLARARGREVRVALGAEGGEIPPVRLPRGVRWGLPGAAIPLPRDMDAPVRAHVTGASHPFIVVSPRGTVTAAAWFVTDGRDALCLRLSGQGRIRLLRWRRELQAWMEA